MVSKICSECGKEITGEVIKYDGKVICQQCCDNILGLNGLSGKNPDESLEKAEDDDYDETDLDDDEDDGFPDEFDEEADDEDDDDGSDSGEDSEDDISEDNAPSVQPVSATEVTEALEEKVGEPTITDMTAEPVQTEEPPKDETVIKKVADKTEEKVKEKVADPDSFGQRFKRWVKLRFKGYVTLKTLSRDPRNGDMILSVDIIKKKDLPKDAVACTNEPGTYCLDTIKTSSWYAESRYAGYQPNEYEAQFKASDACLYMESTVFDNALSVHWTDWSHVDIKKVMIVAFIVLCVVAFFIFRAM